MQKRAMLAMLLAMVLCLSSCGTLIVRDEKVDNAREVIRIDSLGVVYTKGDVAPLVLSQYENMRSQYSYYGMTTDYTMAQAREDTAAMLVENAVFEAKVRELGLDVLTEEEAAQLEEDVALYLQMYSGYEGYTEEFLRQELTNQLWETKLIAHVTKEVTVPEASVQALYEEKTAQARQDYSLDPTAYGKAVLNGETVYWRPAGYRNIRQILIAFYEEDDALTMALGEAAAAAEKDAQEKRQALTDQGVEDAAALMALVTVDIAWPEALSADKPAMTTTDALPAGLDEESRELVRQAAEARALSDYYAAGFGQATTAAYANIAAEADAVLAALEAGEDWDALVTMYNADPGMDASSALADVGYPVCAGFDTFDPAFMEAAMALEKVGDVSGKIPGVYGYYILRYDSDVEEGPAPMETVRSALEAELLPALQQAAYEEVLRRWVLGCGAVIDLSPLED